MNNVQSLILSVVVLGLWTVSASGQQANTIRNRLHSRWTASRQASTEPHCVPGGCIATKNSRSDALWSNYCRCSGTACDTCESEAVIPAVPLPSCDASACDKPESEAIIPAAPLPDFGRSAGDKSENEAIIPAMLVPDFGGSADDKSENEAIVPAAPLPTGVDHNFLFLERKVDRGSTDRSAPKKDASAPRLAQRLGRSLRSAFGNRRGL